MSTTKQLAANRRNAQNSTGPRTAEGKARAARNGLKHGLTAEQQVMPSESEADFDDFVAAMRLEHDPQTPTEHLLVDQIISASWRLQRVRLLETNFYKMRVADLEEHYENDEEHLVSLAFHKDTGPRSTLWWVVRRRRFSWSRGSDFSRRCFQPLREKEPGGKDSF